MDARGTRWPKSVRTCGRLTSGLDSQEPDCRGFKRTLSGLVSLGLVSLGLSGTIRKLAFAGCLAFGLFAGWPSGELTAQVLMAGMPGPAAGGPPLAVATAPSAQVTTRNFIIRAPNPQLAQQAAQLAEKYRRELSLEWLGYEIAPWEEKCPVQVIIDRFPGGETSFAFVRNDSGDKAQPIGWQMKVFGPPDRLLDAVLPHEITHTIFATHFGRPLPRWADEGACTTVEHESERAKNHRLLIDFLTGKPSRGIPFNRMFTMTEYPHDILPLYAQGYSLAKFLIRQKDRQTFVAYIGEGLQRSDSLDALAAWNEVTRKYYGYQDLSDLQLKWLKWVESGSPLEVQAPAAAALAVSPASAPAPNPIQQSAAANQLAEPFAPGAANTINGIWANSPRATDTAKASGEVAGVVQGSWYRQQMRAGMESLNQNGQPASPVGSFRPGSIRSANPEVILRRPSWSSDASK